MAQYQVKTILTDGTELNSGIIDVPGTSIIVNNEELPVADLSNATFIPRYESTNNTTITKTVDSSSGEHSIKWDPISVTGTNLSGNQITAQDSIIELAMGDSDDIVLRSQQTPNASGQYLVWELSDTALQGYATTADVNSKLSTKQDTLVSGTNIKTINGESVLGSGDLTISGGGSNIQIYHGYQSPANGDITLNLFPSDYDLSSNYIIFFITWKLKYGEGDAKTRYYNTKFTYGYGAYDSMYGVWDVYVPENPDKNPTLTWQKFFGANKFNINSDGASSSEIDIVAISIPKS